MAHYVASVCGRRPVLSRVADGREVASVRVHDDQLHDGAPGERRHVVAPLLQALQQLDNVISIIFELYQKLR